MDTGRSITGLRCARTSFNILSAPSRFSALGRLLFVWLAALFSVPTYAADTTKPSTPAALIATVVSVSQINLSWTASTDNVGVTGYRIERCTGTTCTNYVQIATTTTTSYSNTGLTPSTAYRYRVRAHDAAGNLSKYSTAVVGTTQAFSDTQAPSIPTGLTAVSTSSTQINLSWGLSTDNVGVTGYQLERCQEVECSTFTQIASPTATSYSDTGLIPATIYAYRVRALDAASNASAYSSGATAVTQYAGPITHTYTYDALGRISHTAGSDGSASDYQYDANGNVTTINRQ
ncbi:MAG: fibronectin type III domain-containing protein [Steroidobacteraceae bacterium]